MRIRIDDIPYEGTSVNFLLSLDSLNSRVKEGGDRGFKFTEPLTLQASLSKNPLGAIMRGTISGRYLQPCGMCLEEVNRNESLPIDVVLRERKFDKSGNAVEGTEDDVGIFHYEGDYADLDIIAEELIILSLEVYWHPPEDNQGACMQCKRLIKRSKEAPGASSSLGTLLKKAGVH